MATIRQLAEEAYSQFDRRDMGEGRGHVWFVKDHAPHWVTSLAHKAHGDMMPDDWRYEFIAEALGRIVNAGSDDWDREQGETPIDFVYDALSDLQNETEADVYTHELVSWLGSRNDRYGYVDEAVEEIGQHGESIVNDIMWGQAKEKNEVLDLVVRGLVDGPGELLHEFPVHGGDPFERKRWRPKK